MNIKLKHQVDVPSRQYIHDFNQCIAILRPFVGLFIEFGEALPGKQLILVQLDGI